MASELKAEVLQATIKSIEGSSVAGNKCFDQKSAELGDGSERSARPTTRPKAAVVWGRRKGVGKKIRGGSQAQKGR